MARVSETQAFFKQTFGKDIDEFESFQRAIRTLTVNTVKCYKSRLIRFFLFLGEDPDTVIANRQKDISGSDIFNENRYEVKVTQYVKLLQGKDEDVHSSLNRIQGFFTNNSKRLSLELDKLDISNEGERPKYSPSNEEVKRLLSYADSARDKFIICVMFQNGVAPIDVANLKVGDYPLEPWRYYKKKRSKTQKFWHGVSTPEACRYLNEYIAKTPQVQNKSTKMKLVPLLVGREGSIKSGTVSTMVESLIRKSGLSSNPDFIPKCLRDGLEDALVDARVRDKVKEVMMGHTGNIQHAYGGSQKLEKFVVAGMRKAYPLLQLSNDVVVGGESVSVNAELIAKIASMLPNLEEVIADHIAKKEQELFES